MVLQTCDEVEEREDNKLQMGVPGSPCSSTKYACSRNEGRTSLSYPAFPSFIMSVIRRLSIVLHIKKPLCTSQFRHTSLGKTQQNSPVAY